MKKLLTILAFMAAFAVSNAMAARPSAVQGGGSSSGGSSSGGSSSGSGASSSEINTEDNAVKTKYSVSEAEAASSEGSTNSVSWTFE